MKYFSYFILIIMALISGCAAPEHTMNVPKSALDGDWKSTTSKATVRFEKGKISGNDGCNQFVGSYVAEGNSLSVSDKMMSTMMACPAMENTAAFKDALQHTKNYENDGKKLILMGGHGESLLELEALPHTLQEGVYTVIHVNNGKHAVVTLKTPITMEIGSEGKMSGNTGCNQYTTAYTINNEQITIGFPAVTRKLCSSSLMEQEQQFIAVLSKASTIKRNGEKWEVRDISGALLFDMR